MAMGFKVRLGDGSEVGPLDDKMLHSWYEQGLIGDKTPVLGSGVKRWTALADAIDVQEWRRGSKQKSRPQVDEDEDAGDVYEGEAYEADVERSTRWRTLLAAVLLLAGAAGAGWLLFFPDRWRADLQPVPWREVALVQLLFGLILLPGWDVGRRVVRLGIFVAAFAVFPLAGILLAQGLRGEPLFVLGAAWLFASGLFAFLSGPTLNLLKAFLALAVILAGAAGVGYFGVVQPGEELGRLRVAATPERRFSDPTAGLTLNAPSPWLMLKPDAALSGAPAGARLRLADPVSGARAALLEESPARAYLSLDDYLDHLAQARRQQQASWRETGRTDTTVGRQRARRLLATWSGGGEFQETLVAWKDGWTYFAVAAWVPAARAATAGSSIDALLDGVAVDGQRAARLQQAVESVTREVPHLTPATAETVMGQSAAQVLDPAEVFRRAYELAGRGLPSLDRAEVKELGELTSRAYASLAPPLRARLGAYIDRVRDRQGTTPDEDREMSQLMKGAVLSLPPAGRARLQTLFEKAVTAGIRAR